MLVLEGSLSVALEAPDGREVVLGYLNPGEFCGEACLFPDHHLPNTVIRTRRVFVGAGGKALRLLQSARLPEVRGYAVLPVGAAFLRCSDPGVARRLDGKVYGQAEIVALADAARI